MLEQLRHIANGTRYHVQVWQPVTNPLDRSVPSWSRVHDPLSPSSGPPMRSRQDCER